MIVALEGILKSRGDDSAVIKVGLLSLQIYMPNSTLSQLGTVGCDVYLHTHLYMREDNMVLYGFGSAEESAIFKSLISVSGVGPKAALGLLSTLNVEQLISAIAGGNVNMISQVHGIGKKIAGRIILELKGKLEKTWTGVIAPDLAQENEDVIAALTSLGYSLREASQTISVLSISKDMDLEEKVRLALQQLAEI